MLVVCIFPFPIHTKERIMTRAHIDSDTDNDTTTGGVVHREEDQHEWKEATIRDSRSVCPALNAMANHHYLCVSLFSISLSFQSANVHTRRPHSGHNLTFPMISQALRECYNLTYFLSYFLALGGFLVIGLFPFGWNGWTRIQLRDLGKKMGDSYDDRSDGTFIPCALSHSFRKLMNDL